MIASFTALQLVLVFIILVKSSKNQLIYTLLYRDTKVAIYQYTQIIVYHYTSRH